MTTVADSWLPLSPGERSVAIEVLVNGPLSRTELARRLDLSAGSLTRLTKPLIVAVEHSLDPDGLDDVDPDLVAEAHSTVTAFARLRGWSTSFPRLSAM